MAAQPGSLARPTAEERVYIASQWKLVWVRFRRHRIALAASVVIILLYFTATFSEFLAIHDPQASLAKRAFTPPQPIHLDGLRPAVYGLIDSRNPETFAQEHKQDRSKSYPIRFFVRGFEYELFGLFTTDIHLMGLDTEETPPPLYLLGTDRMGRDMWSRLMYGTRVSMSIGLVGVCVSLSLGMLLGGISGYHGGLADMLIQRLIEFLRSIPTIPLWLALAAAVPPGWSVLRMYFAITIIISLIGWTTLAREVRGRFLVLREEDFVMAARLYGTGWLRLIFRHMLPSFTSHIIATTTLLIPAMIMSETALSFLGLGLRQPIISWGVLLFEAQNVKSVALAPWLLIPGLFVIVAVLSLNFMGDGLRDAADPYSTRL